MRENQSLGFPDLSVPPSLGETADLPFGKRGLFSREDSQVLMIAFK